MGNPRKQQNYFTSKISQYTVYASTKQGQDNPIIKMGWLFLKLAKLYNCMDANII